MLSSLHQPDPFHSAERLLVLRKCALFAPSAYEFVCLKYCSAGPHNTSSWEETLLDFFASVLLSLLSTYLFFYLFR